MGTWFPYNSRRLENYLGVAQFTKETNIGLQWNRANYHVTGDQKYMGFIGGLIVGAFGMWYLMENPEAKAQIINAIIGFLQSF